MRLNIRLIGMLHGILMIGMIGYYVMRRCAADSAAGGARATRSGGAIAAILADRRSA